MKVALHSSGAPSWGRPGPYHQYHSAPDGAGQQGRAPLAPSSAPTRLRVHFRPAGWGSGVPAFAVGTYPSGSAALPSSGPSAWPPAAPLIGTAPLWGWGGRWLQSGPAGPAHSPPGLATGPAPGPPAYSRRRPRPPPPPAHPPRPPPPRSSHLVQKTGGESEPWPRQVPPPTAPTRPEHQRGVPQFQPSSSLLIGRGGSNPSPLSPPRWPSAPIEARPRRGHPGQPGGGQRLWESRGFL